MFWTRHKGTVSSQSVLLWELEAYRLGETEEGTLYLRVGNGFIRFGADDSIEIISDSEEDLGEIEVVPQSPGSITLKHI